VVGGTGFEPVTSCL